MRELLGTAASQFGLFTRAQARRYGLTDGMLRHRVRTGQLQQVARHVFAVSGAPGSWSQRVLAACLAGPPACVASHRTAAALHGFDGVRPGPVEVTVPRRFRYRRDGVVVHQSLDLEPKDVTCVGPIPVTTPERTLIDMGAVVGWHRVETAFDGAERDGAAARELVRRRHAEIRRQGRRGVGPMAVVLHDRLGTSPHSVLERRFLTILEREGLPRPTCQHPMHLPGGGSVCIDVAYVDLRLAFELDGHGSHATRKQRAADHARANEIADQGWELRRFTYEQVVRDPTRVAHDVRRAIAARTAVLATELAQ